MCVIFLKQNKT